MKRSLDVVRNSFKLSLLRRYATTNETGVTFQSAGDKGIITLNRPKVLNALNLPLLKEVYAILKCWETEKSLVIAKGAGGKAFSAGGDIKSIAEGIKKDKNFRKEFFQAEYSVMAQIGLYKIPYVSLMDGIAMGAGAAIGLNGCYSVASERTLFSLPETAIGLFPDVGNSYLLPRLEGKLGLYLALTGTRLNGIDVYKAGITTHFCESHKMADLENQLICCTNQASDALKILDKFCEESVPKDAKFSLSSQKEKINSYFCAQSVEDILEKLRCDCSEWSTKTLETLCKMSPTGLKIAKAAIEEGACKKDLQECLRMEYRLIYRLSERHDFFEGVKALLIDKGRKAEWKPQTLQEVSDSFIRKQFAPLAPEEELRL